MKRLLTVMFSAALLLSNSKALAQDEVKYLDRATQKEASVRGTIQEEKPSQIVIKGTTGGNKEIPAVDVIDVVYQTGTVRLNYIRAEQRMAASTNPQMSADDRKKAVADALGIFKKILGEAGISEKVKRHFEFKIAKLTARQADDDESLRDEAIDKLAKFKKDYPDSWQITACSKLLAGLHMEKKEFAAALKIFEELAALPDISKEIKQECDLSIAQVLMADKKYADAEKKLQDLAGSVSPKSPQALRVQIGLAECLAGTGKIDQAVPRLQEIIDKSDDKDAKASAYNTLGDCYRVANKPEEALWAYLWVDVQYNQKKSEHAKALFHLYKLFKDRQDEKKAKDCRDRLEKDKAFAGSEYQRLIANEK